MKLINFGDRVVDADLVSAVSLVFVVPETDDTEESYSVHIWMRGER